MAITLGDPHQGQTGHNVTISTSGTSQPVYYYPAQTTPNIQITPGYWPQTPNAAPLTPAPWPCTVHTLREITPGPGSVGKGVCETCGQTILIPSLSLAPTIARMKERVAQALLVLDDPESLDLVVGLGLEIAEELKSAEDALSEMRSLRNLCADLIRKAMDEN